MIRSLKLKVLLPVLFLTMSSLAFGQGTSKQEESPKNWHQLDLSTTGYYGISLDRAYDFVKDKKSRQVVVAVIDSGVDTLQEDLKPVLWHNPKEIPGNGIDDDHNGYVDDVYGWNFIGGKDGRNLKEDSDEGSRVYYKLKAKYGENLPDPSTLSAEQRTEVEMYKKAKQKIEGDSDAGIDLLFLKKVNNALHKSDSILQLAMGRPVFTGKELDEYKPQLPEVVKAKNMFFGFQKANNSLDDTNQEFLEDFDDYINGEERKDIAKNKIPKNYRADIVKDDESNINDMFYGNKDIMAGTPFHGTHVSGIIAAARHNGKGIDGIADNVRIMMIRAIPDGDEHDKDIANAIRYAVNNGAQIISMSFGKDFSPQKEWVDDAVKYAESNGVLMVHAAGNDNKDIDTTDNFPNPVYADGKGRCSTFITVGASGDPSNGGITASFSNYGKNEVDVFAPGVKIYSTAPGGNNYRKASGTSMAAPVVAGVAAFLLEYYPDLSAKQLKYVIEKSAIPIKEKVKLPGTDEMVELADISKSGGIVNAYEAAKLASTIKGERTMKPQQIKLPIPTIVKKQKKG